MNTVVFVVAAVCLFALEAAILFAAWNYLLFTSVPITITYAQSVGLLLIAKILFKSGHVCAKNK